MPVLPAGAGGSTALIEAAKIRELGSVSALLDAGADIQAKDNAGADALAQAVLAANIENVKLLLSRGATVNARITIGQFSLLHLAAWRQEPELVRVLIANKAEADARDASGSTPLMWSAYSDYAETETTKVLLDAGADPNACNKSEQTAVSWALAHGETAVVKLLLEHGARSETRVTPVREMTHGQQELSKAIALLQSSGPQFAKVSGCISCHNQSLPQMAVAMAKERGVPVDEKIFLQTSKTVMANIKPARLPLIEMTDVVPDLAATQRPTCCSACMPMAIRWMRRRMRW